MLGTSVTVEAVGTAVVLPARQSPPIVEVKVPGKSTTTRELQARQDQQELETPAKAQPTTQSLLGVERQAEVRAVDSEGEVRAEDVQPGGWQASQVLRELVAEVRFAESPQPGVPRPTGVTGAGTTPSRTLPIMLQDV
ncbi:hypothetical protein PHYPSEUDO_012170 [Phytophthora pseudosyringae]|uniref:Uncharacterized protein n=1 Tax=Phytophthora pseudosyringae TaxID=221518 RepID=A0A8T1V822_9STRA|nr:hypothetical protein PHYPSEUDO_012170 [Phytophthora pseudosyringae]